MRVELKALLELAALERARHALHVVEPVVGDAGAAHADQLARLEQPAVAQHVEAAVGRDRVLRARRLGHAARDRLHRDQLGRVLQQLQVCDRRRQQAQRRLQRIDIRDRNRNRHAGQLVLNEDDRQHALGGIEAEAQRLDVGVRVHVDIERRLRHADFDLRPEVGDVGARHRAGLDVEDVAQLVGQLVDICRSVPCCAGILSIGIGTSANSSGITSGISPNAAYLAQINATRASIGIAG